MLSVLFYFYIAYNLTFYSFMMFLVKITQNSALIFPETVESEQDDESGMQ
jgi:hypothetical protein